MAFTRILTALVGGAPSSRLNGTGEQSRTSPTWRTHQCHGRRRWEAGRRAPCITVGGGSETSIRAVIELCRKPPRQPSVRPAAEVWRTTWHRAQPTRTIRRCLVGDLGAPRREGLAYSSAFGLTRRGYGRAPSGCTVGERAALSGEPQPGGAATMTQGRLEGYSSLGFVPVVGAGGSSPDLGRSQDLRVLHRTTPHPSTSPGRDARLADQQGSRYRQGAARPRSLRSARDEHAPALGDDQELSLRRRPPSSTRESARRRTPRRASAHPSPDENPIVAANISELARNNLIELTRSGSTRPEGALSVVNAGGPRGEGGVSEAPSSSPWPARRGHRDAAARAPDRVPPRRRARRGRDGEVAGQPVPGQPGAHSETSGSPQALVVEANPSSPTASAYRLLATEIEYSRATDENPIRSVLVTACGVDEGSGAGRQPRRGVRAQRPEGALVDVDATGEATGLLGLDKLATVGHARRQSVDPEPPNALPVVVHPVVRGCTAGHRHDRRHEGVHPRRGGLGRAGVVRDDRRRLCSRPGLVDDPDVGPRCRRQHPRRDARALESVTACRTASRQLA